MVASKIFTLSVYLQAPEHLPEIDAVVPTYYSLCWSRIVSG